MRLKINDEKVSKYLCWTLSIFILLCPALYNGFPLVTSDSGTYIGSGFQNWVPMDRPIFYGLFIHFTSLNSSLWFTIISQAIIGHFLIWQMTRLIFNAKAQIYIYPIIITLLVSFTSLGWIIGQIMPDIFVGYGVISLVLILIGNKGNFHLVINALILLASLLFHNSHLITFSLFFIALLIIINIKKFNLKHFVKPIKLGVVLLIIILSWLINPFVNYLYTKEFQMQGTPYAFLIGKNIENGIMDKYLQKTCSIKYSSTHITEGIFYIYNTKTNNFFDVAGYNLNAGGIIHQWEYTGANNQKFIVKHLESGWVYILSAHSLKYLTLNIKPSGEYFLSQEDSLGTNRQLFKIKVVNKQRNIVSLFNKESRQFIVSSDSTHQNGGPLTSSAHYNNLSSFGLIGGQNCLCYFKDSLPATAISFLWDNNSILSRNGDWAMAKSNYKNIISDIYFSPEYLVSNLGAAIVETTGQLMHNNLGDGLFCYDKNSPPYAAISKNFPYECKPFLNSVQNTCKLEFKRINDHNFLALLISILIIAVFLIHYRLKQTLNIGLILVIICFIQIQVFNAFTTGALANVLDRLQVRVIWLIPFCALILLLNYFKDKLSAIVIKNTSPTKE
jgi:hypothetical protein